MRKVFGCGDADASEIGGAETPTIVVGNEDGRRAADEHYSALPGPPMPLEAEVPPVISHFISILDEHGLTERFRLGVVCADVSFCIVEEQVRRGLTSFEQEMSVSISGVLRRKVVLERQINGVAPHALSIVLASHDASDMPFDTQLSLTGLSLQNEERLGHARQTDAALRDQVLLRKSYEPRGGDKQRTMLSRPLVCQESVTGTRFGSIEAIGFDSARLFDSVVTLVDSDREPEHSRQLARLFGPRQSPLGAILQASAGGRTADTSHRRLRFYLLPIEYEYTYLLARVYIYLVVHALRNSRIYELPPETIDHSFYEVPFSSEHLVFTHADLHQVVDFVNDHLVGVHPQFDPHRIRARLTPFGNASWVDAWNRVRAEERNRVAEQHDGAADCVVLGQHRTTPGKLRCSARIFVFYALLPVAVAKSSAAAAASLRGANGVLDSYYHKQEAFVDRLLSGDWSDVESEDAASLPARRMALGASQLLMPPEDGTESASESDEYDSAVQSGAQKTAVVGAATTGTLRSVLSNGAFDTTLDLEAHKDAESTQQTEAYDVGTLHTPSASAVGVLPCDNSTPPHLASAAGTQSSPATFVWPEALRHVKPVSAAEERAAQSATSSADTESEEREQEQSTVDDSPLTPHRFPPSAPISRFARKHSAALHATAYSADTVIDTSDEQHGAANTELVSMDVANGEASASATDRTRSDEQQQQTHDMMFALDEIKAK